MEVLLHPSVGDLLNVIAVIQAENDSLRSIIGGCELRMSQRLFTAEDMCRGASLQPSAEMSPDGSIVLKLDL